MTSKVIAVRNGPGKSVVLAGVRGRPGPMGEPGPAFQVDATGLLIDRANYDLEDPGFAYLATDNGLLYFREGIEGWSDGVPFQGPPGDTGAPGSDGRQVELQQSVTHIQWRYTGDIAWTDLVALADLQGAPGSDGNNGADGADGTPVELQVSATHIQWRYVGAVSWTDLIALSLLAGPPGDNGTPGDDGAPGIDGREVQFQVSANHIQWRYVGEAAWTDLVSLDSLVGPAGADGVNGTNGADGTPVELQVTSTHIQWRYVGAETWTNLIELSELQGPPGEQGEQGEPGVAGTQSIAIACSDETTAITAGTAKVTFRMPYAFNLTGIRASLTTPQASGSIFTVDVNEAGTSLLSTKLTIDNTEKTSVTAAVQAVISDSSLADDAEITIDVDQVGDGTAAGLKVYLIGSPS